VTLERIRAVAPDQRARTTVARAATPLAQLVVAHPDEPANDLIWRLAHARDRRALVLDRGQLVGIVSHSDIARAFEIRSLARREGASTTPALPSSESHDRYPGPKGPRSPGCSPLARG
jgi:CBS-domain-containing membrane protein